MISGKYFTRIETLEELKGEYKKLVLKNHPDKGGDVEIMKEINAEYDKLFAKVKDTHKNKDGEIYTKENQETPEEFKEIIDQLIKMDGINIEIIGCFIWISGNTKPHKEGLKKLGFKWHSKKIMWFKAPDDYQKKNKKQFDIDEIRDMYGVQASYSTEEQLKLGA